MSANAFLDTNVLVYSIDNVDLTKKKIAQSLIEDGSQSGTVCISWQVIQEFLNVATHKAKLRLSLDQTRRHLSVLLLPLCTVWPSRTIFERALEIQTKHKLHWYDALIVSGAIEAGCKTLYSEDLQTGAKFGDLKVVNPFARA